MIYDPFDAECERGEGALSDIDPNSNFLNEAGGRTLKDCRYHFGEPDINKYKDKGDSIALSLFHLNVRMSKKTLPI
jgi:hypothetical protein